MRLFTGLIFTKFTMRTEPSIQQLVGLSDQMVSVCTPGEVDAEVVNTAPLHQVIHMLSVIGLIVVGVASTTAVSSANLTM